VDFNRKSFRSFAQHSVLMTHYFFSGALHLDIFDQPAKQIFFSDLLVSCRL
jgi:hypothetical protein